MMKYRLDKLPPYPQGSDCIRGSEEQLPASFYITVMCCESNCSSFRRRS